MMGDLPQDDPRISELLSNLLESHLTPEEVCDSCPELLPIVRDRWQRLKQVRDDLEALLPPDTSASGQTFADAEDELPRVTGYDVEEVIGRGGMGIVFRAQQLALNRAVALKMALPGAFLGAKERLRFEREALAVAALRHPNVVAIYDIGECDGRPYFAMELVEGGSLARKLGGTPLPLRDAALLTKTLAGAVESAHRCGIVHRDLKPANVLLTPDGTPKISDFGLAHRLDDVHDLTRTNAVLGTPSYMAPEQAQGPSAAIGPAADVYALGAILYELLTGRPPFRAPSAAETLQQVIGQDPAPPAKLNASVPRDLATICLKCLHKEPRQRYLRAAALADDLDRFLQGEAISARPEGAVARSLRLIRRRPVEATAIAVASFLAMLLLCGGLWMLIERTASARAAELKMKNLGDEIKLGLDELVDHVRRAEWPLAHVDVVRVKAKLGDADFNDLRARLLQAERDIKLGEELEAIRMRGFETTGADLELAACDQAYERLFREAGLGYPDEGHEEVAERVRDSDILTTLLGALDHWALCAQGKDRKAWASNVARGADPDPNSWSNAARDPELPYDLEGYKQLVVNAPIDELPVSLLIALEKRVTSDTPGHETYLKKIHRLHPDDFLVNFRLGMVLHDLEKDVEAIEYYRAAIAARKRSVVARNNLGMSLCAAGRMEEGITEFADALALDPTVTQIHANLAINLAGVGRSDEALQLLHDAMVKFPNDAKLHNALGRILADARNSESAVPELYAAVQLDPEDRDFRDHLRKCLIRCQRFEEAIVEWRALIALAPEMHDLGYGYAELCLFAGDEHEYKQARTELLGRFGETTSAAIAERVARACLLMPGTDDELRQSVALADRAVNEGKTQLPHLLGHFKLVQALADYRQGNWERAIATLRGDAASVLRPAPQLVLAMALHQSRQADEALQELCQCVFRHDWRYNVIRGQDGWIFHVLRREAEQLIVPDWNALASGSRQPQDDNERILLMAARQSGERPCEVVRLYQAISPETFRAERAFFGVRSRAAAAAFLAGTGRGADACEVPEAGRAALRKQGREWLQEDLTFWKQSHGVNAQQVRPWIARTVGQWQNDPELRLLRKPEAVAFLPEEERKEYEAIWEEAMVVADLAGN